MAYGSALAERKPKGDPSRIATLARLLNPGESAFRSSYTGDVASDQPAGKPLGASPSRQQLALILAGDTGSTTADDGSGTGSGSGGSGSGSTGSPAVQDPLGGGGIRGGSGPGGVGNAGGASQPGNAGAAGDAAGHPGMGGFRSATPSDFASRASAGAGQTASGESDRGYLDIGPVGKGLLSAASLVAPMPYSAIPSLLGAAGRAYNLFGPTADIRKEQGLPPTDFWQDVGAIGDLNGYGDFGGNATIANPQQLGDRLNQVPAYRVANDFFGQFGAPAETQKGASYQPGPGGILGFLMRTFGLTDAEARALSPDETDRLLKIKPPDPDIAALWAGADGNAAGGQPHNATADVGFGAGNYASTTGAPSGPAITSGGGKDPQVQSGSGGSSGNAGGAQGADSHNAGQTGGVGAQGNPLGAGGNSQNGGMMARGGWVAGRPDRIVDNRPRRLDEGEFVVNRGQARRFAPLLQAINSGSIVPPGGRRAPAMAF